MTSNKLTQSDIDMIIESTKKVLKDPRFGGMKSMIDDSIKSQSGIVTLEYGLLAVYIALVVAVGLNTYGVAVKDLFTNLAGKVNAIALPTFPTPGA